METILSNLEWMSFNVFLAMIAVVFGWLMKETHSRILKVLFGIIWIVFLPNTLYILTDVTHFFGDIYEVSGITDVLLIFQYITLFTIAITTYFAALYPGEKVLIPKRNKKLRTVFIIGINILIGYGVTLGRFERTNSWYIITRIPRVIHDGITVLMTPELLFLSAVFTTIGIVTYFVMRNLAIKDS